MTTTRAKQTESTTWTVVQDRKDFLVVPPNPTNHQAIRIDSARGIEEGRRYAQLIADTLSSLAQTGD